MAIPDSTLAGHKVLHDRVISALELCQESPGLDFKESAPWETLKHKIVANCLAMGNLRGGGTIVIGVSERGGTWQLNGISDHDFTTYDADDVIAFANSFVSPHVTLDIVRIPHNGAHYLAIAVHEFERSPLVCKKNGPTGSPLVEGAVYVRPAGKAEATRVMNAAQMDDLLQLAAEKRARTLIEQMNRLGLTPQVNQSDTVQREYDRELGDL